MEAAARVLRQVGLDDAVVERVVARDLVPGVERHRRRVPAMQPRAIVAGVADPVEEERAKRAGRERDAARPAGRALHALVAHPARLRVDVVRGRVHVEAGVPD
ncbi:MAG TPA: hypothetical protein VFG79_00650, partial [Solirubrobacter sp.]|nr:hypothetical protein [Solirubrobacter sp.]